MPMMTSQILKSVDFKKTQKFRYLENETLYFLQIKKFTNYTPRATLLHKNNFVVDVTFKQFWATILSYLQSDRYQRGYFHKIWLEYRCLGKNKASETFYSKFIRCQSPYQLQNVKTLLTLWGHKNPHGQNFWNLIFLSEKSKLKILPWEKPSWTHIIFIYKSYSEIVDKIKK